MAWIWEAESGVDKETDTSKVERVEKESHHRLFQLESTRSAEQETTWQTEAETENQRQGLRHRLIFSVGDEDRGASIPNSMVRAGEGLVKRRQEGARASLFATIHYELAQFHVESLIMVLPSFSQVGGAWVSRRLLECF